LHIKKACTSEITTLLLKNYMYFFSFFCEPAPKLFPKLFLNLVLGSDDKSPHAYRRALHAHSSGVAAGGQAQIEAFNVPTRFLFAFR
jgi:hypothetical protein